jgi:hypothetical protein
MMPDEYLESLRKKLKGFSQDERAVLIEEIGSHIEGGEEDPKLGKDPVQRRQKIMSKLDSPEQMAKGFKKVYQPGGLVDYLLIAIPYLLNLPINLLLVSLMPKYHWADARMVILFHIVLLVIGLWRRSIFLTLFWLADLAIQLIFVLWVANGYYGLLQTSLWGFVVVALIFQWGRMIWQYRRDLMIVIFAFLPVFMGFLALSIRIIAHGNTYSYEPLEIFFYRIYLNYANYIYYAEVVALAPFFMARDRNVRWLALAIFWLLYGLVRESLDYQVIYASVVYYVWIFLPLAVVFLGWFLERSKRRELRFAT